MQITQSEYNRLRQEFNNGKSIEEIANENNIDSITLNYMLTLDCLENDLINRLKSITDISEINKILEGLNLMKGLYKKW